MMEIRFSRAAVKAIHAMDGSMKKRIRVGIEGLLKLPPEGDIKLLQGFADGRHRLRVGKYRVIYRFGLENAVEILEILDIGSRGGIYK